MKLPLVILMPILSAHLISCNKRSSSSLSSTENSKAHSSYNAEEIPEGFTKEEYDNLISSIDRNTCAQSKNSDSELPVNSLSLTSPVEKVGQVLNGVIGSFEINAGVYVSDSDLSLIYARIRSRIRSVIDASFRATYRRLDLAHFRDWQNQVQCRLSSEFIRSIVSEEVSNFVAERRILIDITAEANLTKLRDEAIKLVLQKPEKRQPQLTAQLILNLDYVVTQAKCDIRSIILSLNFGGGRNWVRLKDRVLSRVLAGFPNAPIIRRLSTMAENSIQTEIRRVLSKLNINESAIKTTVDVRSAAGNKSTLVWFNGSLLDQSLKLNMSLWLTK
jgi:hypothetical protein